MQTECAGACVCVCARFVTTACGDVTWLRLPHGISDVAEPMKTGIDKA